MVWEGRGRPASASGLLHLYVSRVHDLLPAHLLGAQHEAGCAVLETSAAKRESLSIARDLALGMGLSVLEPGCRSHASVLQPRLRLCRLILRVLHSGECAAVELSHDDVWLKVSCTDDEEFMIAAHAVDAHVQHRLTANGFSSDHADRYSMVLGRDLEETAQLLLRLLTDLRHATAALDVALFTPRPRRVR